MNQTPAFPGYILALTGPSGVGKSTISKLLARTFAERMSAVPILTTRGPKSGDEGEYKYVTLDEFHAARASGRIVAFANIPSSSEPRWYGYDGADIAAIWKDGKLPVVITEMNLLQTLAEHYGRRSILSFGLLPPGNSKRTRLSALLYRLRERGRDSATSIQDRLQNAEHDLLFFDERSDLFDHLVVNDQLDGAIHAVSAIVLQRLDALKS